MAAELRAARLVAFITTLVITGSVTGCLERPPVARAEAARPEKSARPAAETPADTASTNPAEATVKPLPPGRYRDDDYAFEMSAPGPGWEFWDAERVRQLNADACLGLVSLRDQGFMIVVAERLGDVPLDDFAGLVLDNLPFTQTLVRTRERTVVGGEPALRVQLAGSLGGVDLEYLMVFVVHEGFHYQILGWSLRSGFGRVQGALERALASFQFVAGRKPRVRAVLANRDDQDVDWRIRGDRYENASYGFRLDSPEGWRFAGRSELDQMNTDASAGLLSADPQIYQIYVVESVGEVERERHSQLALRMFAENVGWFDPPQRVESITIGGDGDAGGIAATEHRFEDIVLGGARFDMVLTTAYRDRHFYQVQTWWPAVERAAAAQRYAESYRALSFLDEPSCRSVREELEAFDCDNAVGRRFALRQGVYRDFDHGFVYRLTSETWRAWVGDEARLQNPDAALLLENCRRGLFVAVVPERLEDVGHEEYHAMLLGSLGAPADTATTPVRHATEPLLGSTFELELDGIAFSYGLVTAVRGERKVQLLAYGLRANLGDLAGLLPELAGGLEVPRRPTTPTVQRGTTFEDRRLGFALDLGEPGWSVTAKIPAEVAALANQVIAQKGKTVCVALALCEDQVSEEVVLESLLQAPTLRSLRLDPRSRRERPEPLAGLPGRHLSLTAERGLTEVSLDIWLTRRGNTYYALLVSRERGWLGGGPAVEAFKKKFRLLD